jgi:hypothetical protein
VTDENKTLKFCPWLEGCCNGLHDQSEGDSSCCSVACPGARDWGKDSAPDGVTREVQSEAGFAGDPTLRKHLGRDLGGSLKRLDRALTDAILCRFSYGLKYFPPRKPKSGEVRLPWNSSSANRTAFAWACSLYGLTPGVVAVRFLETIMSREFDSETALSVSGAIDAWSQRGAPSRRTNKA